MHLAGTPHAGHSFGGGVGTLAAVFIALELINDDLPVTLLTIGAPRVGDRDFAILAGDLLSGGSVRVFNRYDMVPCIPIPENYWHHNGRAIELDGMGGWRSASLALSPHALIPRQLPRCP